MDKIILSGMEFYGYHGVLKEEKRVGQPFIIGVEMFLDLLPAGVSDDLTKTVHYGEAYLAIKKIVEEENFDLIEALAQRIGEMLLQEYPLQKVRVIVDKPLAPVPGGNLAARIEIEREK
ncbi:dihydroneopterin aldolase [Dehalobacterium formicoaceticum]|uniref:dihydroneopterin aldolase n=1 Tax=Dehalobacterium formicoaceticum TaxID=51515 RepID=UPI000B7F2D1F|nr:dihydroneopterin aldolase [Dehalobacterium formicoaceticum]